jgi:hypothetical protein
MKDSQLIELIQRLKQPEKAQILQFAAISLFNDGRMRAQVIPLLEVCLEDSWHSRTQNLDKKTVFALVFPDQKFVEGKLEKVMVEAHRVVKTFLLVQNYLREDNGFGQTFDFAQIARMRGLEDRHQKTLLRLQKIQEEFPWKNATYFYHQFLLEKSIHDQETLRNHVKGDLNIPKMFQALDIFFNINHLAMLNYYLLQRKVTNLPIHDLILSLTEVKPIPEVYLAKSPILRINFEIFKLLKKEYPEFSDISNLFNMLRQHEAHLDEDSLREFYTYLRNVCILVLSTNFGQTDVDLLLLELYKDNLQRGYLHYEGKLIASRYWAVSSNATRVKDFDWALEFIEAYKHDLIGENETQDIYRLNLANYLFAVGRFSECLDNIPDTSPYVDYLLLGKRLELKTLYELNSELLPYKLDAFKMFLSRTSQKLLSESQRKNNSDFANLLTQITNSPPGSPKRAELMVKRVQENKQAAEWRWLLEKAKALKNG